MRIRFNLQVKALAVISMILFLALSLNTLVLTVVSSGKYRTTIYAKTIAIMEGLHRELSRALNLGVPLEYIDGLNNKLKELLERDKDIGYSMIVNANRKILFHSDPVMAGRDVHGTLTDSVSYKGVAIYRHDSFYEFSMPLNDASGKNIGELRLGIRAKSINKQVYGLVIWALGISILCFSVAIILVYLSVRRFIIDPVKDIEKISEEIADGNLTVSINIKGNDEIAILGRSINRMASNLKNIVMKARSITDDISNVMKEVRSVSQKVIEGSSSQKNSIENVSHYVQKIGDSLKIISVGTDSLASSIESISSSVTEMSYSIDKVADNANKFSVTASDAASSIEEMLASIREISESLEIISSSSDETASSISEVNTTVKEIENLATESSRIAEEVALAASEKGISAVKSLVDGMVEIKNSVIEISDVINSLSRRSEDITKILNVISDVTDQTGLLALNAAILAAQAGEHGKGFSVVADEIKNLAEKTALSTKEIADIIVSIQKETERTVETVRKGVESVEKGVKLVNEMDSALKSIFDLSNKSFEKAKIIQRATVEEVKVINGITTAVRNMTEQIEHISRSIKEQSMGSKLIIEAMERIKELSVHVKTATREQSDNSKQITISITDMSHHASQIANAISEQKQKSIEIIKLIMDVENIASNSLNISQKMDEVITSLEEKSRNLSIEMERFRI